MNDFLIIAVAVCVSTWIVAPKKIQAALNSVVKIADTSGPVVPMTMNQQHWECKEVRVNKQITYRRMP